MKNITKILIALFAIVAFSCTMDDVEDRPVIDPSNGTSPVLTAPSSGASYTLLEVNKDQLAERFTWTAADFGGAVEIVYSVEIDKKGNEFKAPQNLGNVPNALQLAVSVEVLNNAVTKLAATPLVPSEFEVRVKATTGTSTIILSESITIIITPYTGLLTYEKTDWYLIGAAVKGGWDNNADTDHQPMFRDGVNANKYSFVGFFKAGNFKLISEKGSWATQVGRASATDIEINGNAGEWTVPSDGYYKLTFDTTALTYTFAAYDASTSPVYLTIGIIGDATPGGWDADTDMTKTTFDPHVWTITVDLVKNGAKFRADNAWAKNWGGDTAFSSIGSTDANIPVTGKSKFLVHFSDIDGSYSMIPNQK